MSSLKVIQNPKPPIDRSLVKSVIAVAAGKGGVGKSSVTVNLALALRKQGFKVGLIDADIYGPSLKQMLPEGMEPANNPENPERLLPAITFGMPYISVAHFKKEASIVRAPIANQIIDQFLNIVDWGPLDYLLIDFPPGTGDIQLTLMQKVPISAALMITTPQIVSTIDVSKAMQLFQKMQIPILGVVENMSYFLDPNAHKKHFPFGKGGGERLSKEFSVPFLGQIPIDPKISEMGDEGKSLFEEVENSLGALAFTDLCEKVLSEMDHLDQDSVDVRPVGASHLEFLFGGKWQKFSLNEIQKKCPCARCETDKKSDSEVSFLEFSLVGRYAIKIKFSSGCSLGIYPFSLLRQLIEA